jgi:hypothetical protein
MPQNNHEQRLQHLLEHQAQDLALLKDYEDKLRLSDDPIEKLKCKNQIAAIQQRLQQYDAERAELQRPILANYLEYLVNHHRDMTVKGIMQTVRSVTTLPLDEVYVSLAVTREVSARLPSHEFFAKLESESARQWEQAARREHWPNHHDAERRTERIECHQAVNDFDRIVFCSACRVRAKLR